MNGEEVLRVPSQPGTDIGEMIVRENRGCLDIERYDGSVTLSKHQQIALRDWLVKRWGAAEQGGGV